MTNLSKWPVSSIEFSTSLAEFFKEKQQEVNRRGLMGYPVDTLVDEKNQACLAQEISTLKGIKIYESPTTGLRLPVDKHFPANMLYYFLLGDYEEHDMQIIRRHVQAGDHVLELGGGVGLTGSLLGKVSGNTVSVCEPNAALYDCIERTFCANDVSLNLIEAAAIADSETAQEISFNVSKDYWWSSLVATEHATAVNVKTARLGELIAATNANTLLIDIEGYEVALLSDLSSLASIKTVLIELHTPSIGTASTSSIITNLVKAGLDLVDIGGHTFVFTRRQLTDNITQKKAVTVPQAAC
jgi:FkbM family methyltransferase